MDTMADTVSSIDDLTTVHVGNRLEAWSNGVLHHLGIVEEKLPELGVLWIRESGTGQRKMLDVLSYDLRVR
ncbi:hypothetical protein CIK52_15635 [Kocuria rosea]|nr:hypothetical protein CIK52_15635 [Kocuria rosea]